MARIILLDAGPLGIVANRPGIPIVDRCQAWLVAMEAAGAEVLIPTITDYEVRRELIRLGATAKLRNLDALAARFDLVDIGAEAYRRAAEYWALVRRAGRPTAPPDALDADCILAGLAVLVGRPGDVVTIATNNIGHFRRFPGIDAREWATIAH